MKVTYTAHEFAYIMFDQTLDLIMDVGDSRDSCKDLAKTITADKVTFILENGKLPKSDSDFYSQILYTIENVI